MSNFRDMFPDPVSIPTAVRIPPARNSEPPPSAPTKNPCTVLACVGMQARWFVVAPGFTGNVCPACVDRMRRTMSAAWSERFLVRYLPD